MVETIVVQMIMTSIEELPGPLVKRSEPIEGSGDPNMEIWVLEKVLGYICDDEFKLKIYSLIPKLPVVWVVTVLEVGILKM